MTRDQQRPGALAAIGNTPVVRLSTLPGPDSADVWVKLEAANPTGSQNTSSDYAYALRFDGDKIAGMTKIWHSGLAMQELGWA